MSSSLFSPTRTSRSASTHSLKEASHLLLATSLCSGTSVLLLPSTGEAAIAATPGVSPATPLNVPANLDGVYLNVLTGNVGTTAGAVAGWDLNPYGISGLNWYSGTTSTSSAMLRYSSTSASTAGSMDLNMSVDGTGVYSNLASLSITTGTGAGEWKLNSPNYFGFRFFNETTSAVHYGWGRLTLGATATSQPRFITEIYYETTPGTAITIGAVPEPTAALLAAGATGLALLRRRRA